MVNYYDRRRLSWLPYLIIALAGLALFCLGALIGGGPWPGSHLVGMDPGHLLMNPVWSGPATEFGLETAVQLLTGRMPRHQQAPLTREGFRHYAKMRQEAFCNDGAPLGVFPGAQVIYANDSMNSTLVKISPEPVYITVYGGSQDHISRDIMAGLKWEASDLAKVVKALESPLPPGSQSTSVISPGLFVDVGANLGGFTLEVAAAGYEVIAFEGMRSNQRLLRTSLCASAPSVRERVTLHAFGLGAERMTCYLIASRDNRGDGIPICGPHNESHAAQLNNDPAYVVRGSMDIERLDDVIQQDIKVMKVDVEGFEPFVLQGMQKLLRNHTVWYILIEYNRVLLKNNVRKNPNMTTVGWVLDLFRLGYHVSIESFDGPFISEDDMIRFDASGTNINKNLFLVHANIYEFQKQNKLTKSVLQHSRRVCRSC